MISFKEYITEEDHIKKAETAVLAGDYQSALHHLKQHVPGKSRIKDAYVSKMMSNVLKKKINA